MTHCEFNTLVMQHRPFLTMYALRFTHDADNANDLVHDTMLKAITYFARFKEGSNIKSWLYTIMKNTFINSYRLLVRTRSKVSTSEEISSANLLFSSTENLSVSKFIMDDIKAAMSKLPVEYAIPFTMKFEGHKYHEIAEYLTIPIGTAKTRVHLAKKLLKINLQAYEHLYKSISFLRE